MKVVCCTLLESEASPLATFHGAILGACSLHSKAQQGCQVDVLHGWLLVIKVIQHGCHHLPVLSHLDRSVSLQQGEWRPAPSFALRVFSPLCGSLLYKLVFHYMNLS